MRKLISQFMLCVIAGATLTQFVWAENRNKSDAIRPPALLPKFDSQRAPGSPGQWWAGSGKGAPKKPRAAVDGKIRQLEDLLERSQGPKRKPAQMDPSALNYHHRLLRIFQNGRDSAGSAKEAGLFKGVCVNIRASNTLIPSALAVMDLDGKRYFIPLLGESFEGADPAFAQKLSNVFRTNPLGLYRLLEKDLSMFSPAGKQYPSGLGLGMLLKREFADSLLFTRSTQANEKAPVVQRLFRVRQSFESGKTAYLIQETCHKQVGCYLADEDEPDLLFASPIMHCYYDEEINLKKAE